MTVSFEEKVKHIQKSKQKDIINSLKVTVDGLYLQYRQRKTQVVPFKKPTRKK